MKFPSDSARALLQSNLNLAIDEELDLNMQLLNSTQEMQRRLASKDRELHASGADGSEVESIDAQIDTVRQQIDEEERRLIAAEQRYSKILCERKGISKFLVGLSEGELAGLKELSHSYQAFESHLSAGLDTSDAKNEGCAWNACWTCSEACGGCTGCGQACSQLNACVSRPAS